MKKRILACLLALVMLVGLLPATVLAEDAKVTTNEELIAAVSSVDLAVRRPFILVKARLHCTIRSAPKEKR